MFAVQIQGDELDKYTNPVIQPHSYNTNIFTTIQSLRPELKSLATVSFITPGDCLGLILLDLVERIPIGSSERCIDDISNIMDTALNAKGLKCP